MTIVDGNVQKPNILERITESLTPLRLLVGLGAAFLVSLLCLIGLGIVEMAYFTAQESDVPWLFPALICATAVFLLSGFGFVLTLIVAVVQADGETDRR